MRRESLDGVSPYAILTGSQERQRVPGASPRQFSSLIGARSLLQQTIERVSGVVPPERIYTVIERDHRPLFDRALSVPLAGPVLEQPAFVGSAPEILLPLAFILDSDPDASVMVFPATHFVYPEGRFLRYVAAAYRLCHGLDGRVLLLGVPPRGHHEHSSWIVPQPKPARGGAPPTPVARLVDSADGLPPDVADSGALGNTAILAARARTLWSLAKRLAPAMMRRFEVLRSVLHAVRAGIAAPDRERLAIEHVFHRLPPSDFVRDLLAPSGAACVVAMDDVVWRDWERPEPDPEALLSRPRNHPVLLLETTV